MKDKILYRLSEPTHLDQLPKGTIIHVTYNDRIDVYQQNSSDDNSPNWSLVYTINKA
jgi:hypothetical protein